MRRALLLGLLLFGPAGLRAYNITTDRWAGSPVVLQLQLGASSSPLIDGSASWGAVAEDALALWNSSITNLKFAVIRDSSAAQAVSNGFNNVFFSPAIYGDAWGSRTLAITLRRYTGTSIVEADVLFNSRLTWDSYRGNLRNSTTTIPGGPTLINGILYDFRRVALHEFGHALGLDHPDDIGQSVSAIMNSAIGNLDTLMADDIAGAQALYDGTAPPIITTPPANQTVTVGSTATFHVSPTGSQPFTYQWFKNGTAIPGATNSFLTLNNASLDSAGSYTVTVSNAAGSATSAAALLIVNVPVIPLPIIFTPPRSQTVAEGQAVSFTLTFSGTGQLTYQWRKDGTPIPGATNQSLMITSPTIIDAGDYTVTITNAGGSVTSTPATLTVIATRLTNLSVRTTLTAGQILTVGFTVTGGAKSLLLRAAGPGLAALGVTGTMADPKLVLFKDAAPVATNDNWSGDPAVAAAMTTVGAFPFPTTTSLDAALVRSIEGGHTVQVSGPTAGNLIVEAYDAGSGHTPRLTNLSALNRVGTGTDLMIAGFTLTGLGPKRLLIRAIGPTLAAAPFNLTGTLVDPRLELYNSASTLIAVNDTWASTLSATFSTVGAFPLVAGSKDAAMVVSLLPGGYTVQVAGNGGATGLAIVEIYELP